MLVAGLLSVPCPASAQILIDGFLDSTSEVTAPEPPSSVITDIGNGMDRQISVQATGAFSIVSQVLAGVFVVDAGGDGDPGTANVQIDYLGFEIDLSDHTFFQLDVSKIVGTPTLVVLLGDADFGQIAGSTVLQSTDTTQSLFLDITQFDNYAPGFGSKLNSIQVVIGGGNAAFFVEASSIQFSTVPEPSSGLLTAAGVLAAAARRRIRR